MQPLPYMTPSPIAQPNQATPSFQMTPSSLSKQNMNQAQQPAQDTVPRYGSVDCRLPVASPFDGPNRRVSNRALLVAQEELFGSTPNSPLMNRPSKLGLIMQSYEQLVAGRSPRHGSSSPTNSRGRFPEDQSSEVSRDMPIIGQLYQVRMPHIILRENCEISQNNAIVAKVYQGDTVKILRHEISSDAKLRVQVITSTDKIGWCTMNTAKGDELLVLVTEEV